MKNGPLSMLLAVVIVGGVGWLLYAQAGFHKEDPLALLGFPSGSPSPTPLLSAGSLALRDAQKIVAASSDPALSDAPQPARTLSGGLKIQDTKIGSGESIEAGMKVRVQYTGRLLDGTVFDDSLKRGSPLEFILGSGAVIKGWDIGLVGMRVGGKRSLLIPSALGYGLQGGGEGLIPPDATLLFDVDLLSAERIHKKE